MTKTEKKLFIVILSELQTIRRDLYKLSKQDSKTDSLNTESVEDRIKTFLDIQSLLDVDHDIDHDITYDQIEDLVQRYNKKYLKDHEG